MAALEAGRENYKNKDYKAAALCFTEAIEASDTSQEEVPKLYSNRSACRMHLEDFKGAREDAEACTALTPGWAKGWGRLGAARAKLGETAEAITAYEKAHELDATCSEYIKEAAKLATPPPVVVAMAPEPFGGWDAPHLLVRGACLAGVISYAASFSTDQDILRTKYRSAVRWALLSSLLHLLRAHGRPKVNADYARRVFTDPQAQRLFGVIILLVGSGSLFGLIPVADAELAALFAQLATRLRRNAKTRPLSLRLISACEGPFLDGNGRVTYAVLKRCSLFEVTAACVLLLELFTKRRNPILTLLYWQYLQMRCLLERATAGGAAAGPLHDAFFALDARIVLIIARLPVVLRYYTKFTGLLARQVHLPAKGSRPKPRCSDM